jgi:hypothetical protein
MPERPMPMIAVGAESLTWPGIWAM